MQQSTTIFDEDLLIKGFAFSSSTVFNMERLHQASLPKKQKKMDKCKDLCDFEMGQMARRLDQSNFKTSVLVGCSQSAVARTYQKWSKEEKKL